MRSSTVLLLVALGALASAQSFLPNQYGAVEAESSANSFLPGSDGEWARRIPQYVEPLNYYIRIQVFFPNDKTNCCDKTNNMTFEGVSTFIFRAKQARSDLTVHSSKLVYKNATLYSADGTVLEDNLIPKLNDTLMHATVSFAKTKLVPGETYMVTYTYSGKINSYLESGIYYTSYTDVTGVQHFMLASHMEPASARSVFPCLDEPAYKAVFHLTLIYPRGYVALANSLERPAVPVQSLGNWDVIQFPPSLKMSTYIVAFAIGDYRKAEKINEDGTLIRIWGWPGQEGYLQYAADTASECIYQLGVYAGFKYPYIKSDMLGMPEFVAGAMENYGLIIYKYQYISYNDKVHTTKTKEMAAETICHELAHQWFGDTVTSEWWSDLFLNEGFATYFQTVGQKLTYPKQSKYLDGKFEVNTQQKALFADARLDYSHPIYDMNGPLFDDITYQKGGSMLKMIESVLGPKVFQTALQNYIKKYKFSTATHEQLFEEFTKQAQKDGVKDWCGNLMNVSRFLDPWFYQQSFPLVNLTNADLMPSSMLTLSQQPFNAIDTLPVNQSDFNYAWPIPFYYHDYKNNYLDSKASSLQWIVPDYMNCPLKNHPVSRSTHWEMGNAGLNTFARVEYDDEGYARLMKQLKTRRDVDFSTADKVALIGDQLAFAARDEASGGRFSFRKVLELLTTILPDYQDFATFKISQELIDGVERLFMDGPDYPLFKKAITRWFGADYDKMGYNVTGDWDMDMLSYLMLPYPVRYDVSDSNKKAAALFQQFLTACKDTTTVIDDCNPVKPDLRVPMYCAGVRLGSQADFERMLTIYDNQVHNEYYFYHEYYSMIQGLSCSPRREDIMKVIPRSLHAFRMPHKKKYFVPTLSFIAMWPAGSQWLAEYLDANPVEVMSSVNFEEYLIWMTSSWYSQHRVDQYAALKQKILPKATTDEQKTLLVKYENVTITQLDWHRKYYPDILKIFYDSFSYGPKEVEYWVDRLPQGVVKPIQYNITLRPYFNSSAHYPWYKELTFEASVDIELLVQQKPTELKLNANRMLISAADIVLTNQADNSKTTFTSIAKNIDSAFLTIPLPNTLIMPVNSTWTLSIKYTGFIYPEGTDGVYLNSNYFEFNDKKAFIFSTFFEKGPSARSLVPCFDEPAFKAKWQVTIEHPADMIALSNMPSQGFTVHKDGWATTRFPPTPPMSSYLFAVAVGHFASVDTVSESGVLVRAWAWTGMERYGDFALKLVAGSVDFMSSYFDIPFMLPKLDAIALPKFNDRVGAEEHWGLMHFSYTTELVDPLYADGWDYFWVGSYLGHETVHQWFGDLVTTEFFNKMFLNEALAQYWETTVIVETYPEQWRVGHFERFRKGMDGFREDSPPMNSPAIVHKDPPYSTGIIYDKGATLMHMLKHTVGDNAFQMGLTSYLKKYSYGNTNDVQLWQEITDACNTFKCQGWNGALDVKTLMDPWIYQASFPVLKLTTTGSTVAYTQEPFIPNPVEVHGPSQFDYKWIIPVQSKTASGSSLHFFRGVDGTDPFFKRQLNGWQVENANFTGFYRVWYDDATWAPILQQLKSDPLVFDENTRASFIADAAALRERGSLKWSRLLETAFTLQNEEELAPWFAFAETFDYLIEIFRGTSEWNKFKSFANKILKNVYAKVAWKKWADWSHDKLATHITEWACAVELPGCRDKAKQATMNFAVNCLRSKSGTGLCNTMSPNVRRTQYCWGTRVGADSNNVVGKMYDWFVMNSKYFARDSDKLMEAQACTLNTTNLNKLIVDTLAGKLPSKMLKYLATHDETRQLLWNEFELNTNLIIYGNPSVEDYVNTAMSVWTTAADVDQATQFLQGDGSSKLSPADKVMMQSAIIATRARVVKVEADKKEIVQWLNANVQAFFE